MYHSVAITFHLISLSAKSSNDSSLHHLRIREKRSRRRIASQCNFERWVPWSHNYQKSNKTKSPKSRCKSAYKRNSLGVCW